MQSIVKKINCIYLFICLGLVVNSTFAQQNLNELEFSIGTWKVENKENYEVWNKLSPVEFSGEVYKLIDNSKNISETLTLKIVENKIVYQATVPSQNDGKTIDFNLNTLIKITFSFENLQHDFPKKIQYKKIDQNKIFIQVLGEDDKGFSYFMNRE